MPGCTAFVRFSIAAILFVLGACASKQEPHWTALAQLPHLIQRFPSAAPHSQVGTQVQLRVVQNTEGTWYETLIRAESWSPAALENCWKAPLPCRGVTISGFGDAHRVIASDGRVFENRSDFVRAAEDKSHGDWSFVRGGKLYVHLDDEGAKPSDYTVRLLALSSDENRRSSGQVKGARFSGEGFGLLPGFGRSLSTSIPPNATLRFATAAERILNRVEPAQDRVTFRVLLNGQELLDHEQEVGIDGSLVWHQLDLPVAGLSSAEFSFEVSGNQALTSFLSPFIAPAEVGTYGLRPWGAQRENIIVFLADTFRADNLAAYGGDPALTPNLNAFAEESLTFERAWSTGTSTLPAHISMFTGLYPMESGAASLVRRLPASFDTIAERLARHGYRTGAITDSVVMSRTYGFEQGFAHFDELHRSMDSTLQRTQDFLAADDGRPVFLFVHSYRAHEPYTVSDETKTRLSSELDFEFEADWETLTKEGRELSEAELDGPRAARMIAQMLTLYRGASADLDRGFGRLREILRQHRLEERGTLIVTSDHGEAFHEHGPGDQGHAGHVWEEQVRIPFLVHAKHITPGRNRTPISIIDFAPSLADIAGVPADENWRGSSIFGLQAERPLFAFECGTGLERRSTVAIVDSDHKLILFEADQGGRLDPMLALGAFDLSTDPGEAYDLQQASGWPSELRRRLGPLAESYLVPRKAPEQALFDADHMAELNALGYSGEDESD